MKATGKEHFISSDRSIIYFYVLLIVCKDVVQVLITMENKIKMGITNDLLLPELIYIVKYNACQTHY